MDYEIAVMFELAVNVRRTLEAAGREPTNQDDSYIVELREKLDNSSNGIITVLLQRYPNI